MFAVDKMIYAAVVGLAEVQALCGSRVYEGVKPEGKALPAVVFFQSSGTRRHHLSETGAATYRTFTYTVKVIAETDDKAPLATVDEAIEAALSGALAGTALAGTTWRVASCQRTVDVNYTEDVPGRTIRHVGGTYSIHLTR